MEGNNYALLSFCKETDEILAVFLKEKVPGSYKLMLPKDGKRSGFITAKGFFDTHGLTGRVAFGRYDYRKTEVDGQMALAIKVKYRNKTVRLPLRPGGVK